MIIIPAIDIMDGQVVRLKQGKFVHRKNYSMDPVTLAKHYQQAGFTHLHVVDLDGAKTGKPVNRSLIIEIARQCGLVVDVGGGLKDADDFAAYLENGISAVNVGSLAVKNPKKTADLIRIFGNDRIYVSLDLIEDDIRIHGWQEKAPVKWRDLMKSLIDGGAQTFVMTDISRDGMLSGVSKEFYQRILDSFPHIRLIASGGVSGAEDIFKLDRLGVYGVITGKALLEGKLKIDELAGWLC
jgi:phosphoribosylformimino-5-aminoimidazole carboxamide ribotide isomerase